MYPSRSLLVLLLLTWVAHGAVPAHPFGPQDLLSMVRIGQIQVSPDGSRVAFEATAVDIDANRSRRDIWLVRTDGAGLRALTDDPAADSEPIWSVDGGQVLFISDRSGTSQVWRVSANGGQAMQVTDLPLELANLKISPDGRYLAFTAEVFADCNGMPETAARLKAIKEDKATGRVYDRLFVRHWDQWRDGRRSHLFVMPIEGGQPVDLMAGMDADCPPRPFGRRDDFVFSPDGKVIVFTARVAGRAEAWSTDFDLFAVPVDGSARPRLLTEVNRAWDGHPAFCPDGRYLAYLAMARPGYESDRFRIVIQDWPDGQGRVLAEDWDRSPSAISWAPDGSAIYAISPDTGRMGLFRIDLASGSVQCVVQGGAVEQAVACGDRVFYSLSSFIRPAEIYCVRPDGTDRQRITAINDGVLSTTRMGQVQQFWFEGWGGDRVYAYLISPADLDPSRRHPVAMLIHGGPQGSFADSFHYRWNPQVYAGAGYAVLMVDFHGSTGYGQAFTDSIRGDWGGKPLEDLKLGLATALRRYPWLDGSRVAALGASYGGYMINWIAGNWPDRFRCLVNHAGSIDERIGYLETEELWFPEWEFLGQPWTNPASYERWSPINCASQFRTPMLVIHGGLDYRVPDTQGIATFTLLQRMGVPSRLLYFPDEGHWVQRPQNCLLWHKTVLEWLACWLRD